MKGIVDQDKRKFKRDPRLSFINLDPLEASLILALSEPSEGEWWLNHTQITTKAKRPDGKPWFTSNRENLPKYLKKLEDAGLLETKTIPIKKRTRPLHYWRLRQNLAAYRKIMHGLMEIDEKYRLADLEKNCGKTFDVTDDDQAFFCRMYLLHESMVAEVDEDANVRKDKISWGYAEHFKQSSYGQKIIGENKAAVDRLVARARMGMKRLSLTFATEKYGQAIQTQVILERHFQNGLDRGVFSGDLKLLRSLAFDLAHKKINMEEVGKERA